MTVETPTPPAGDKGFDQGVDQTDPGDLTADIDTAWDFSDPAGTEARFRAMLARTEDSEDPAVQARQREVRTQLARSLGLQKKFDVAHAELDAVDKFLSTQRDAPEKHATLRVRSQLERGRLMNTAGEAKEEAADLFRGAFDMAQSAGLTGYAVDAAHMVAIVGQGTPAELEWNTKALGIAENSDDPKARKWLGSLYNNVGWAHHDRGDFETALTYFDKALTERKTAGKEPALRVAWWTRARCLRSLERYEEALGEQQTILKLYPDDARKDGFVHEEIGELMLALGKPDAAKESFAVAYPLLRESWVAEAEPERLARIGKLAGMTK